MKHVVAALLAAMLVLSGCAAPASTPNSTPVSTEAPAPGEGVEVDKNLLTVDITLPASMFEDSGGLDTLDLEAYKAENGFMRAVKNADGSLTVTMTKAKHKEVMFEISDAINEGFSGLLDAEKGVSYLKSIEPSADFKQIKIRVNREEYDKAFIEMTPFIVGLGASMYMVYAGEEPRIEITICDDKNGDEIKTVIFPDEFRDKNNTQNRSK